MYRLLVIVLLLLCRGQRVGAVRALSQRRRRAAPAGPEISGWL